MKDAHVPSNPAKNGRPVVLIFVGRAVPQSSPLTDSVFDMAVDDRALRTPYQRADDRVGLARVTDFEAFRDRDKTLTKCIEDWLFDENARISHANLALVKEDAEGCGFDRVVDVRVARTIRGLLPPISSVKRLRVFAASTGVPSIISNDSVTELSSCHDPLTCRGRDRRRPSKTS